VRADLGDTIQTGGAETGASTCQSCPALPPRRRAPIHRAMTAASLPFTATASIKQDLPATRSPAVNSMSASIHSRSA
jgi:hypothetical protein